MRRVLTAAVAAILGALPSATLAGLEICNDSEVKQTIAVGYKSGDVWVSEGWWGISPGDCVEPVKGDLKNRYYYLRAQAKGWQFDDERIPFCTTTKAFTIEGDEDCAGRGFDKRYFRKIDTGTSAKHFKVELAAFVRPDPTEPAERGYKASPTEEKAAVQAAPEPPVKRSTPPQDSAAAAPEPKPAATAGFAPGTHGDPWDGRGIVQGCEIIDGYDHCAFYADGMKFMAPRGGPSDGSAFSVLSAVDPGTPVMVKGDIVEFFDRSVEFAISQLSIAKFTELDVMLHDMQGQWYSVDDPASQFTVLGAEWIWTYDGDNTRIDPFSITTSCGGRSGGPYIASLDPEVGDTLCYSVEKLDRTNLVMMYVDNGNFLEYRRLD